MASLAALEAKKAELIDQISSLQAVISVNQRSLSRAEGNLPFAKTEQEKTALQGQISALKGQILQDQAKLGPLNAQLAEVNAQIAALSRQQAAPKESVGETAREEQTARAESANSTNPPTGPLVNKDGQAVTPTAAVPNNAEKYSQELTTGTNGRVRPLSETQGTPAKTAIPGAASPNNRGGDAEAQPGGFYGAYPSETRGQGAPNDDNASNQTRQLLNQIFGSQQKIVAQDNPLDKYASYTYNISIYLMSPSQYKKMQATKQKNIAGFQLLMQSGGAPTSSGETVAVDPQEIEQDADGISTTNLGLRGLRRNQFFPLDFYIEDVRLKSFVQGRGTRSSHNVFEMGFKIIEPNGISLLDRLYAATAQYMPGNPDAPAQKNYAAQNYLMVIRFYGYDEFGNLVRPQALRKQAGVSDADAIIEKWIPFQFTSIRFRIANRLTEYECTAVCPQNTIATGQMRGVIPYNVELNAVTLADLLTGRAGYSTPQQIGAADGRQTSGTAQETAAQIDARLAAKYGLPTVGADTEFETRLSAPGSTGGTFGTADSLNRALGQEDITTASVNAGSSPTQNAAPPKAGTATKTIASGLVDALNQFQKDQVAAKIVQYPDVYEIVFKDPVLAQAKLVPEGLINKKNTPSIQTTDPAQKLLGSKQSVQVDAQTKSVVAGTSIMQFLDLVTRNSTYMTDQQTYIIDAKTGDPKSNGRPADTVGWFNITTQIEPLEYDTIRNDYAYKITYVIGPYAVVDPKSDWFPQSVFRGTQKKYSYWFTGENTQILDYYQDYNYMYYLVVNGPSAPKAYTDRREYDKAAFQTASGETNQGQENNVYGPVSTLADVLYSPADTARAKLTIVGDPDWIQQGSLWNGALERFYNYSAFLPDGTVNYDSGVPLFEVLFNTPVDYDLNTGLMDPERSRFANDNGVGMQAKTSYTYQALVVSSIFNRGRFIQELEGVQTFFPVPTTPTRSTADTAQGSGRDQVSAAFLNGPDQSDAETRRLQAASDRARNGAKTWTDRQQQAATTMKSSYSSAASRLTPAGYTAPNNTTLTTPPDPTPPTSGSEVVGPAASGSAAVASQGGAAGPSNVTPTAFVVLKNGGERTVTSQEEIRALVTSGQASPLEGNNASRSLAARQNAANSPQSSAPTMKTVRET